MRISDPMNLRAAAVDTAATASAVTGTRVRFAPVVPQLFVHPVAGGPR
jgi:hypothetical protein